QLPDHLSQASARFENDLAPKRPWTMDKMSAGRREAMMKAIVGLVMAVENVEGSFKLNQHKSDADHVAVTRALALQKSASAQ
ncbi:FMN-binding negative transcriptional regulator, partial [Salmonella enterica]|uniref:FMN-binding negative transcriptional regulator n=2 Tax=Pseudomonadota TaxID=1224 RepID=UPI0032B57854